jgi:signal transduction histidine kinase
VLATDYVNLYGRDITERVEAEEKVEDLAKLTAQNPNPVLRISKDGTLLYANRAAAAFLNDWNCDVGQTIPDDWLETTKQAFSSGAVTDVLLSRGESTFVVTVAPLAARGYVNLYASDITELKRVEREIIELNEQLEQRVFRRTSELRKTNQQLRELIEERKRLEKEVLNISEREQRRIGQELHDSLGQMLTGAAFMIKVLQRQMTAKGLDEAADAAEIADIIRQATDQAKGLAKGLHPVDLDARSLSSALEELAASTEHLFGIRCTFTCSRPVQLDDSDKAVHLYRIAQEAVTNAIKHGKAASIQIELTGGDKESILNVTNDGLSFPKEFEKRGSGMGLQIMDQRVDIIGGSLEIHAGPEGGAVVNCRFPNKTPD